jgi:hypothetical protein
VGSSERKIIINKEYNPHILSSVLRRNWYWPLAFIFLFFCFAFLYLRYTKAIYSSNTLIQIENKDQAKEVLNMENINSKSNVSSEIELLKSQFLFEKAIDKLNMNVSLFSKGKILTEEMYRTSSFNVQPYSLSDSALCNVPIYVEYTGNNRIRLNYELHGQKISLDGSLNDVIQNSHFKIVVKTASIGAFKFASEANQLYFVFNERKALIDRLLPGLIIVPINLEAKTIEISYQAYNPVLCNDIVSAITSAFFEYDESLKKQSSDNILQFIGRNIQLKEFCKFRCNIGSARKEKYC